MNDCLAHRGPDDAGAVILGSAGLAQRRLSIIDLSPTGHQPMATDDGRWTIVYNGELYNFPALRERLEQQGERFRGRSDTEVILKAYARWGIEVFPEFNGMFAIALWDRDERRLRLVRDRFGIKPIYYAMLPGGGIVFGSEIKAVLASGRVERRLNWAALHEYMYYGNPLGANTMFDGVIELLPGHVLTVTPEGARIEPFWSIEQVRPIGDDVETATSKVREKLEQAVKDHLISDVPVGVFLSGGIDSSAITALASRHYGGRLKTYSVGFDFDGEVNELAKARRVAEKFGTDHRELHIAGGEVQSVIERLVRSHDEPFADAANIPLFLLCEALRGEIKVALQGDGGDEIFAGYRRYNVLSHERFWRTAAFFAPVAARVAPRSPSYYRAMRFLQAMRHGNPAIRMALLLTMEPYGDPPTNVFSPEARRLLEHTDPFQRYREMNVRLKNLDVIQRMLYTDCQILLPDQFLEKVDKSTMANSIEIRVPFLDTHLTEYVLGLPSSMKVRNFRKKWILRRALRGIVPDEILDGPKTGFGVPYSHWLRTSLVEYLRSVLLDPATMASGLFKRDVIEAKIAEHVAGRRDNGFLLYKLLNFALWRRMYMAP